MDVEFDVHAIEVQLLVLWQIDFNVSHDVLYRAFAHEKVGAHEPLLKHSLEIQAGTHGFVPALAPGYHHFPAAEQQNGARGVVHANGHGREALLVVGRSWYHLTNRLKVQRHAVRLDLCSGDDVVDRG